jgi:hypothetical protein
MVSQHCKPMRDASISVSEEPGAGFLLRLFFLEAFESP